MKKTQENRESENLTDKLQSGYSDMIAGLLKIQEKVAAKLKTMLKGYDVNSHGGKKTQKHAGLIQQNMGIGLDYRGEKVSKYYISFTSMNVDKKRGNIHEVIGRIQFMIKDINADAGDPNDVAVSKEGKLWLEINYPTMSEDYRNNDKLLTKAKNNNQYDWKLFFGNDRIRRIYQTGYKLIGDEGRDAKEDIILNEENISEFCTMIVSLINYLDSLKEEGKIN